MFGVIRVRCPIKYTTGYTWNRIQTRGQLHRLEDPGMVFGMCTRRCVSVLEVLQKNETCGVGRVEACLETSCMGHD